jgi:hypothetical protein
MATTASAAAPIVLALVVVALSQAQTEATVLASFEVSSVKANRSGGLGGPYLFRQAPGGITATNISLNDYVRCAYGVRDYQISAPAWFR